MSKFPLVSQYLAELPTRLRSYPNCTVKMSVVRAFAEGHDVRALAAALPDELEPSYLFDLPVTSWIPEVHATVVYLTIRELFFESDDSFVAGAHAKNLDLLNSTFYRTVARLISPARLNSIGTRLFQSMHRGVQAEGGETDSGVWWDLRYPVNLVPVLVARCYATALAAALETGGARDVQVQLRRHSATRTRFVCEIPDG